MIVCDASVLIAHFDGQDAAHGRAEALLESVLEEELAASSITLAEVLVAPARLGRLGDAEAALRELAVEELPSPPDAARALAELRARTSLKLPDCCVLLTAERSRAAVATFDVRLTSAAGALGLAALPG